MSWLTRSVERLVLALIVMALFAGAVVVMSFIVVPEVNRDAVIQLIGGVNALAGMVIGGVNALAGMVIGFYFSRREYPGAGER